MVAETVDSSSTAGTIVGIRSDVYERRLELIWMTKDDIETFETRLADKTFFENLAIFALSAFTPLGVDKFLSYLGDNKPTDLAIVLFCFGALILGIVFHLVARSRRKKVETFKERLFKQERLISRQFSIVDTSSNPTTPIRVA
jgi:hypothetical protein